MSFLASEILTNQVPPIIGDALATQIAADELMTAALLRALSSAVRLLYSKRPDAAIDDAGNFNDYAAVTSAGQSIPLDDKWIPHFTYTVAAHAFLMDAENQDHRKRAADYFALAREALNV